MDDVSFGFDSIWFNKLAQKSDIPSSQTVDEFLFFSTKLQSLSTKFRPFTLLENIKQLGV